MKILNKIFILNILIYNLYYCDVLIKIINFYFINEIIDINIYI